MGHITDCFFIGHNEISFTTYEKHVKVLGVDSEAYRNYNLNFIRYKGKAYSAPEAFNLFSSSSEAEGYKISPVSLGDLFSLTIAYLGTFVRKKGFTFDYVNSFQDEKDILKEKLKRNDILCIAIPTTLYVTAFPIMDIISFIRKYNNTAKIVVGGPYISTQARSQDQTSLEYLFKSLDADFYVNSSQGEGALVNLLNALKHGLPLENIPNIIYKTVNGYNTNPVEEENNDLEENTVDWSVFKDRIGELAAVRTSLSCPFSCSFCSYPEQAGRYRTLQVDKIEEELRLLDSIGTVRSLNFIDDTFNVPPKRFKEILRMLIKNKFKFKWNSYFRCQYADRETVELMKESGCEGVFLGIESGSQKILNNMNKVATVEKYREGIELLNEYGITSFASFIIGFPGETHETVQETKRFIEETKPSFYRAQIWYCDVLTPIWKDGDKYNIKGMEFSWTHSTMDSKTACDYVDEFFLNIKNSKWMPEYNFEYESVFKLLLRGMSLEQIYQFIDGFNDGIKERLRNPEKNEISEEVFNKLRDSFIINKNNNSCNMKEQLELSADFEF